MTDPKRLVEGSPGTGGVQQGKNTGAEKGGGGNALPEKGVGTKVHRRDWGGPGKPSGKGKGEAKNGWDKRWRKKGHLAIPQSRITTFWAEIFRRGGLLERPVCHRERERKSYSAHRTWGRGGRMKLIGRSF